MNNSNYPKVAVLMSTYNGDAFLVEQLDSILNQKCVNVSLFIRDDGSSDSTSELLKEYRRLYDNVYLSFESNIGVGNSFMTLLYSIPEEYDYYCFADQDDYWLDNKLIRAIESIHMISDKPVLYASNQLIVDKSLNPIKLRFSSIPALDYGSIISGNQISGCTMVWNATLQNKIINSNNRPPFSLFSLRIHDVWIASIAAVLGTIIFDEKSYILYRQHDNNVVGVKDINLFDKLSIWKNKLFDSSLRNGRSLLCEHLLRCFKSEIEDKESYSDLFIGANYKLAFKYKIYMIRKRLFIGYKESYFEYVIKVFLNLF